MIAERLRILRKEKGLSKRDLVATLPLNYSTYANYESGFREPNSEVLQILASHFGVSIDYLIGVSESRKKADEIAILTDNEHDTILKYRQLDDHGKDIVDVIIQKELERVTILSTRSSLAFSNKSQTDWLMLQVYQQRASVGIGNYLSEDNDKDYDVMPFMPTPISRRADFCVRVKGDSMEPKIKDGDIVFVKAVPKVETDNIGIFVYEEEAYCKRLRIDHKKGALYLDSLNTAYAPRHITQPENLRTVGLVLGIAE